MYFLDVRRYTYIYSYYTIIKGNDIIINNL